MDLVLSEKSNGVLTLTLNRPEKKNALTRAMYQALADGIDGAGREKDVRCVLLQAEGDMFTAGNDLGDFAAAANKGDPASDAALIRGNPLLIALAQAKTPIVAAVNGRAVGIGTTMLLHCDLVFVSDDALLTTPFVNLALVPEAASSLLLPARIGHVRTFAMFVLGQAGNGKPAVGPAQASARNDLHRREADRSGGGQGAAAGRRRPRRSKRRSSSRGDRPGIRGYRHLREQRIGYPVDRDAGHGDETIRPDAPGQHARYVPHIEGVRSSFEESRQSARADDLASARTIGPLVRESRGVHSGEVRHEPVCARHGGGVQGG